jgi:1-aminocyclopropane-1-carboxylate deaminase
MDIEFSTNTSIEEIVLSDRYNFDIKLFVKRDDLIHPEVSGNKLFKLKYNIEAAERLGCDRILTFGGAFSNHIAATAAYCAAKNLKCVGIIRGERPKTLNPTLVQAEALGMKLDFIPREDYRKKDQNDFLQSLRTKYANACIIPEGGSNLLGIEGAMEMLNESTTKYDYVVVAMGTGTTFAGLVRAASDHQKVIGLPIHKHDQLLDDILLVDPTFQHIDPAKYEIVNGYHFGGYAKWTEELLSFIRQFYEETGLKLDPIYTGKAVFGLLDLAQKGRFSLGAKVLFIHTGGIQGVAGFEERFWVKIY